MTIALLILIAGYFIYKYGIITHKEIAMNVFTHPGFKPGEKRMVRVTVFKDHNLISRKIQYEFEITRLDFYKETLTSDSYDVIEDMFLKFNDQDVDRFIKRYLANRDEKAKLMDSLKTQPAEAAVV